MCILNATAGSNRAAAQRETLDKLFAEHGHNVRIVVARDGTSIVREAKDATARECDVVIAAGGDGTVSAVACMLASTDAVLGVLPLGTLNHFARDLKIPLALADAVANIFSGTVTSIDIGEVNGQKFVNNSSLGLYPGIVQVRESLQKTGHHKWPAFARALVDALWRFSPLSVRLAAAQAHEKKTTTPFVFIGNNRYELATPNAGTRPTLQEGQLWVYQAPHAGRAKLIGLALRALFGHPKRGELETFATTEFWIRSRKRHLRIANDGEVMKLATPLHYRSIPGALRVIVPLPEKPKA